MLNIYIKNYAQLRKEEQNSASTNCSLLVYVFLVVLRAVF